VDLLVLRVAVPGCCHAGRLVHRSLASCWFLVSWASSVSRASSFIRMRSPQDPGLLLPGRGPAGMSLKSQIAGEPLVDAASDLVLKPVHAILATWYYGMNLGVFRKRVVFSSSSLARRFS